MKASVQNIDMSGVTRKLNAIKNSNALGLFASSEAARLMNPYVPRREGDLASSANTSRPWVVSYNTPYARSQYYGTRFRHPRPPNIRGRAMWDKAIDKGALARAMTRYLRR